MTANSVALIFIACSLIFGLYHKLKADRYKKKLKEAEAKIESLSFINMREQQRESIKNNLNLNEPDLDNWMRKQGDFRQSGD